MARTGLGLRECEEGLEAGGLLHKERFAEAGTVGAARRGAEGTGFRRL